MMIVRWLLISIILIGLNNANAAEEILSFHSDIQINIDGSLHVIESIKVRAENQQIKRGIYRDFPTVYHDNMGTTTRIGFELLSVKRDGMPENYHLSSLSNGVRIYTGKQDVILDPAVYSYQIEYRSTRQLGFFKAFDELYWNVTGNGWIFPIQQASANVVLPQAVAANRINMTGYTGVQGATDQFLTHHIAEANEFYYETTQPLSPYQGLTIVLNWPKGIIKEPSTQQRLQDFIQDNKHNLYATGGLLLVFIYYLLVWMKVGKDPEKGLIVPLYQAPEGFSPASIRFISAMKYDDKCFSAALINLAVKGAISINQDVKGKFNLTKKEGDNIELAPGEAAIMQQLFKVNNHITLKQSEHERVIPALREHASCLYQDYESLYYRTNKKFFAPGIVLSIAAIILSFINMQEQEIISSTIFVGMFTLIPFFILGISFRRFFKQRKFQSLLKIAVQLIFFGIFFSFAGDMIRQVFTQNMHLVAWPVLISSYLLVAGNILFEQWLKAPTLAGRRLLDKIEGFKLYLNVAEEDELKLSEKPQFTTDIYEKFLPYAIALGVESAWSKQLDAAISAGIVQSDYHPTGLAYHHSHHDFGNFSENLSDSMTAAVSSASTAPGSSSGSSSSGSSGGSSGGGGGGGGGGGW
jgi:uncharacterized membrane protein YgcG